MISYRESSSDVIGPFKVIGFDKESKVAKLEGHEDVIFDENIKDVPHVGYNYAFEILGNKAIKMLSLTVDAVITTGKEVLLIKRKGQPFAGSWALPGGFIEPGEKPEDAAARETQEEAGMAISNLTFIGKFDTPKRDPRMENVWSYAFKAEIPNKESIKAGDDASDAKWVPIEKLKDLSLAFDHAEILRRAGIL
jgi:8-oxo-dGTP diphosphatase